MSVLRLTPSGLHCAAGDFFIDPHRSVDRALVTHGHSDHARRGHGAYLCTDIAAPVITHRLGVMPQTLYYGQALRIGEAEVSFHPAGHVPGSAQIRVTVGGETWVVSGDYKLEADGVATAFEPVPCHTFISECTFGLPVFHWRPQAQVMADIHRWWAENAALGRVSTLAAYSLGKAQRLLAALGGGAGPILLQRAIAETTRVLERQGLRFPAWKAAEQFDPVQDRGALLLAPPAALAGSLRERFADMAPAQASGWMQLARHRRDGVGFVLSDHADWRGLQQAVEATGAARVLATHGYTEAFSQWLIHRGLDAAPLAQPGPHEAAPDEGDL